MSRLRVRAGKTLALVAVAALASSVAFMPGAGAQASDPGVTDSTVKLGIISAETGVAASTGNGSGEACKARIERENAKGGVNGRKIELIALDDQSSAANLDRARDLVENRGVFAVINASAFGFLSYRYLQQAGVPVIGGGYDGSYYFDKGSENIISALGQNSPVPGITYTTATKMLRKLGGKKFATVGYGISQSSSENAKSVYEYAAPKEKLEPTYINTSVDFGSTDVGPIVLGIKNSGADAIYLPLNSNTNLAIIQGLLQNNHPVKGVISATGYGQELLDSPVKDILTEHDLFQTGFRPVELGGKGVKQFLKDRKKYSSLTGVPDWGEYTGYVACDIAVMGLQKAGQNLTRQSFIDAIRSESNYTANGLLCQPWNYTMEQFGKVGEQSCQWYVYVKDGKWKVANNGKPVIGDIVGKPELLQQYRSNVGGVTPTTEAPG